MVIKKLLVAFAAACFAQVAIAAGPGDGVGAGDFMKFPAQAAVAVNTQEAAKPATAFESSVAAPVQLTDAEMDKVVAGRMYLYLPSGEIKHLVRAGGDNVSRVIRTPGACLVFNFAGSCAGE